MKYKFEVNSPFNDIIVNTDDLRSCGDCNLALIFPNMRGLCNHSDFKSRVNGKPPRLANVRGYAARCYSCLVRFSEYEQVPEYSTWYQVWHTEDYRVKIDEIQVIESQYMAEFKLIALKDGGYVDPFGAKYTCFPTKDAAEGCVKRRIRNEIKKRGRDLETLKTQHKLIKEFFK